MLLVDKLMLAPRHLLVPLVLDDAPVYSGDVPSDNPSQEHESHAVTDHNHRKEVLGRQLASSEGPDSTT